MSRKERVLAGINREGVGIEIGPSHDPIASKREGFKVHVIDHMSRDELRHKFSGPGHPGVVIDNIEEVDFVWHGERYADLTGRTNFYDWIIGSHLIEHTPDLVRFLEDCDALLKDEGVLSLVIPDKRYCFDRFRPITGLARVVDAHVAGNTIHSAGTAAEYFMNVASKGGLGGWSADETRDYAFYHSTEEALNGMRMVLQDKAYLDVHNWCFVPHSFRLLVHDLHALGMTRLREVAFTPTEGFEFFVTLGRHGTGPGMSRLELLKAIDAELAVPDAVPAPPQPADAAKKGWLARLRRP